MSGKEKRIGSSPTVWESGCLFVFPFSAPDAIGRFWMQSKLNLNTLLRPHWKALSLAFAAVIIEGLTDLLDPWPIKIVLDQILGAHAAPAWLASLARMVSGENPYALLNLAALATVLIASIGAFASYTENFLTTKIGQQVMHDLRQILYHHIQRLSLTYYDQHKTGDLISRVTDDVDSVQSFIASGLLGILINLLTLTGMTAVMFYLNWRFTLVALSVAPFLFLQIYTLTHRIKQATRAVRKKESEVVSVVQETLSSIRVVKAFGREDFEEKRLEKNTLESMELALRARSIKAMLSPMVDIMTAIGSAIVLWYGARLALAGSLTPGSLVVFLLYLGKMYKPMRDLSKMTDAISKALIGAERIQQIIQAEKPMQDSPQARRAPRFHGDVRFEHVSFNYRPNRQVLTDLSFHLHPGQFGAFVGPTGAGKSTIISLLPRFYAPHHGRILIDGEDIRNFTVKSLREQLSFVLQDTILFRATIAQNIAYGRPGASPQEIKRAARLAFAEEFIEQAPEGYQTMVGERGMTLSGGQRQRISIARAIIRNSPILILDEPTSGLDSSSEKLVIEALETLMRGRTTILIAHNLETVRDADLISVVNHGKIVESGRHQDLLALDGLYAQLYQNRYSRAEVG
jgi:ATP-binding cassette, subfamily B, bacterial